MVLKGDENITEENVLLGRLIFGPHQAMLKTYSGSILKYYSWKDLWGDRAKIQVDSVPGKLIIKKYFY